MTVPPVTAVPALQVAQYDRLSADAALQTYVHEAIGDLPAPDADDTRIYNLRAQQGTVGRYVILGASREARRSYYGQSGQAGGNRLHCWAEDKVAAATLYGLVAAALRDPLTVDSLTVLFGTTEYVTDQIDPTTGGVQVVADFRVQTVRSTP